MAGHVAEFIDVSKTYGSRFFPRRNVQALRKVNFSIASGEVLAIVGPNRAGKTTLLKILLGLCRATSGQVLRFGRSVRERATLAAVGYMHENQVFPPYQTGEALLMFYGGLTGRSRVFLQMKVPELLERLGLADRAHEPISRYSKGMVQRLALAQAVLAEPDLLVLDEPMEGLDLEARRLLEEVVFCQRRAGKTVLLVTHALADVARVCDRVAVLVDGRLVHSSSLVALLRDPQTGLDRSLETALGPMYGSLAGV